MRNPGLGRAANGGPVCQGVPAVAVRGQSGLCAAPNRAQFHGHGLWSGIVLALALCVSAQGQVFKRGERKSLLDSDPDVLECGTHVPLWMTPA